MFRSVSAGWLALALALPATAQAQDSAASKAGRPAVKAAPQASAGPQVVVLETAHGRIVIRLAEADAPKTAANFRKLVREKFYDGTSFHRVIASFMIQGGDPNSRNADPADDGAGGPGYTVAAEIKLKHVRGAVATARQGDQVNPTRASSGSQFFINVADLPSLDRGGYTVFGHVISGMDAVDKIAAFAGDATLPAAGGGGRNPGKKAQILKASFEPLSKWEQPANAAEKPAAK